MINLKKWVFILFIALVLCISVYGRQNLLQLSGLYFMQNVDQNELSMGKPIFLFSKLIISNVHQGNIFIVGTTAKIRGTVIGDIYCISSDLIFDNNSYVSGDIRFFSSKIEYSDKNIPNSMIPATNLFLKNYIENEKTFLDNVFPFYFYSICFSFVNSIIGVILLSVFKNFFQQGSVTILKEINNVIKWGSIFYGLLIALTLVFIISIVGFPIALIFIVLLIIFICCGSVSLSIYVGFLINKKFLHKADTFSLYFLGSIIIEAIKCLPYIGIIFSYTFISVFTIGVILKTFANRSLYKIYYSIPYPTSLNATIFDKSTIKQTILKKR